jgi:hypothetical protein
MKSLIQFIESEKKKGRDISTQTMRNTIIKKLNDFYKVRESTFSMETIRMCNFFIEELEDLYKKTYEYDSMETTLKTINKQELPDLAI